MCVCMQWDSMGDRLRASKRRLAILSWDESLHVSAPPGFAPICPIPRKSPNRMDGWRNGWMRRLIDRWVHGWTFMWMDGLMYGCTHEFRVDGWTWRWMFGYGTRGWIDLDGCAYKCVDGCICGWMTIPVFTNWLCIHPYFFIVWLFNTCWICTKLFRQDLPLMIKFKVWHELYCLFFQNNLYSNTIFVQDVQFMLMTYMTHRFHQGCCQQHYDIKNI